jgi:hypothetical protein
LQKVADHITQLLVRYNSGGRRFFRYLDCRNEPDFDTPNTFYSGTATELAQEQRVVYQTAKAIDPTITIVSPSDWSAGAHFPDFLAASDGAGGTGKKWIDGLCLHPYYRYWHTDKYLQTTAYAYDLRVYIAAARAAMVAAGLPADFPIYCSEIGYASDRNYPDLIASTPAELAIWAKRLVIGWATVGIRQVLMYAHDTTNSGNPSVNSVVSDAWNSIGSKLPGRTITEVWVTPEGNYWINTTQGRIDL